MNIKRYNEKFELRKVMKGDNTMNYAAEHKPGNVLLSLKEGFKEVKEHKSGTRILKSLKESEKLWKKWANEDE